MNTLKNEIISDIVGVLLHFIPGGNYARRTAQTAATLVLSRQEKDLVKRIANRIFDQLYEAVGLDAKNPGAAKAAAYNVLETIRRAELTPEVIVDCDLDSELLFKYVMKYPAAGIESASLIRRQLYNRGLRTFCDELIANAFEITVLQLLVSRKILSNQSTILRMLHDNKTKLH